MAQSTGFKCPVLVNGMCKCRVLEFAHADITTNFTNQPNTLKMTAYRALCQRLATYNRHHHLDPYLPMIPPINFNWLKHRLLNNYELGVLEEMDIGNSVIYDFYVTEFGACAVCVGTFIERVLNNAGIDNKIVVNRDGIRPQIDVKMLNNLTRNLLNIGTFYKTFAVSMYETFPIGIFGSRCTECKGVLYQTSIIPFKISGVTDFWNVKQEWHRSQIFLKIGVFGDVKKEQNNRALGAYYGVHLQYHENHPGTCCLFSERLKVGETSVPNLGDLKMPDPSLYEMPFENMDDEDYKY